MATFARSRLRAAHAGTDIWVRMATAVLTVGVVALVGLGIAYQRLPTPNVVSALWWAAAVSALGLAAWLLATAWQRHAWRRRKFPTDPLVRARLQAKMAQAIDVSSQEGVGALHEALKEGADPRLADPTGQPLLVRAVRARSPAAVQTLLDSGVDLEQLALSDALVVALEVRDEACTQWLLASGANPYAPSTAGIKPGSLLTANASGPALPPRLWVLLWSHLGGNDQDKAAEQMEQWPAGVRDEVRSLMDLAAQQG